MKFAYTILYVPDVNAATQFYNECFGFATCFKDADDYAELETEGVTLAFAAEKLAHTFAGDAFAESTATGKAPAMEICFVTDNVHAAVDKAVKGGAAVIASPEKKPWGQTVAYVRDLNGFIVELATPATDH